MTKGEYKRNKKAEKAQKEAENKSIILRRQFVCLIKKVAIEAAQKAIENAAIDPETLDYIIFAHNFGDVKHGTSQSDIIPSLATRVKHKLQIKNPKCVAYDIIFGCPGWI